MRAMWIVTKREVYSFFVSPIAYVVLAVWMLFSGLSFYMLAQVYSQPYAAVSGSANALSSFFGGTTLFYLPLFVFAPVLTMRGAARFATSR